MPLPNDDSIESVLARSEQIRKESERLRKLAAKLEKLPDEVASSLTSEEEERARSATKLI